MSRDPWIGAAVPAVDASDASLTVTVYCDHDPSTGHHRRIEFSNGEQYLNISLKSALPLVKKLLDLVQVDIVMGGELTK